MTTALIRLATPECADQIAVIYAPFVESTPISFELEPPDAAEMRLRIVNTMEQYPWLVCEKDNEILGYVYASQHRTRAAYQWSVDTAVYTRSDFRRSGLGRALYTSLLAVLPLQGFYNACAGIALPNEASVGLHEALGFGRIGIYRNVGYKMGRWHDVGWWQRALQTHSDPAAAPLLLADVRESDAFAQKLAIGLPLLRI